MVESVGRIFLAVDLTDEARQILSHRVKQMAGGAKLPGRAAPPRNWHLTLCFLGDLPRDRFEFLMHQMSEAPLDPPFRCRFGGLGSFPRPARATVLWVGLSKGAQPLSALASRVAEAVKTAGLRPPERPFSPHLTLSRVRPPQDVRPLVASAPPAGVEMTVAEVTVFRSHLGGGPPRYQALERFPLS